ncbi:MAG: M14 family metallopeptidase [Rubrivivax sp.]|nr:M14 family metallopeptidase [Rubrivivax sp.]
MPIGPDNDDGASSLACFSATYAAARAKLHLAASEAGAVITRYVHPGVTGPDGDSLSVDVAAFGPPNATRSLLVLSGTHGTEGRTGSAAQLALVRSGALARLPADMSVILVHAINPYGFAYDTRTTENNVDLNRNFIDFSAPLPTNPAYQELHDSLCPAEWTATSRKATDDAIAAWIATNGQKAWLYSIMKGQYDDPTGLNFGGRAPEWSNQTLRAILREHLPAVRRLGFIDWHSGLGQTGEPFFLCFNDRGDANWQRACAWWGRVRVESAEGYEGGERPPYNGLVFYGVRNMIGTAQMTGAVIEFGTVPLKTTFDQLRIDRWLKFGRTPDEPTTLERMRREVAECFTPEDAAWRSRVVAHARAIQLQALDGVAHWV